MIKVKQKLMLTNLCFSSNCIKEWTQTQKSTSWLIWHSFEHYFLTRNALWLKCPQNISYIYMAHVLNILFMQQINQTRGLLRLKVFHKIWNFPFSVVSGCTCLILYLYTVVYNTLYMLFGRNPTWVIHLLQHFGSVHIGH
jgi:hypothetical protein